MEIHLLVYVLTFVFGLVFGSFFNVAIHRWPQEEADKHEWVNTPSHCPKCGARIRWYDNIPLVSYFVLLRGRCRDCGVRISIRYPLVELSTAILWVVTLWLLAQYGLSGSSPEALTWWQIVLAICFASLYFLTVVIDFETQLIPFEIVVPYFILSWVFVSACFLTGTPGLSPGWVSSLIGMVALSAFFYLLYFFGGMGGGDVLFALGLGVLFGWKLVIAAGFLAVLMGGIVGIVIMLYLMARGKYRRKIPIPFGPYLAISAYICMFAGNELVAWYLSLFGFGAAPPAA